MKDKNSFWIGIAIGLAFTLIAEGFIFGMNFLLNLAFGLPFLPVKKMLFAGAALNILTIRYYFVNREQDKTGSGIVLITVVLVVLITLLFR
jgi:hypothetical protein